MRILENNVSSITSNHEGWAYLRTVHCADTFQGSASSFIACTDSETSAGTHKVYETWQYYLPERVESDRNNHAAIVGQAFRTPDLGCTKSPMILIRYIEYAWTMML